MKKLLRSSLGLFVLFTILFGFIYPGIVTIVAQTLLPQQAAGSLIVRDGKLLGSELIGQNFSAPKYFWGRLSATSPAAYNAAASTGSNFGAANPALLDAVKTRIDALKQSDPGNEKPVPVDLVTASGSGLDPHISPAAAAYQAARVVRERNIPLAAVAALIEKHKAGRQFDLLGEERVNVLMLNLDLDGKL
jgi:K+-transporting ATPase ATPase C chain